MIVKIKCKNCKYKFVTIATGAIKIPEWINKWLKKCTCPSCESIDWVREGE